MSIEGFDDNLANELKERANVYLKKTEEENIKKARSMGIEDYLINDTPFNSKQLIMLVEKEIKSRDDLADLSSEELIEIIGTGSLQKAKADEIIIEARKHWFDKV